MTQKEQTRLQVLNSVLADQVPVCQAAEVLGVSERHMRRILAAYRKEGAAALAHGNRGRRPANTTTETKMTYVVQLARTRYAGTNHTHLAELLMEREGILLSAAYRATAHEYRSFWCLLHPSEHRHEVVVAPSHYTEVGGIGDPAGGALWSCAGTLCPLPTGIRSVSPDPPVSGYDRLWRRRPIGLCGR